MDYFGSFEERAGPAVDEEEGDGVGVRGGGVQEVEGEGFEGGVVGALDDGGVVGEFV